LRFKVQGLPAEALCEGGFKVQNEIATTLRAFHLRQRLRWTSAMTPLFWPTWPCSRLRIAQKH